MSCKSKRTRIIQIIIISLLQSRFIISIIAFFFRVIEIIDSGSFCDFKQQILCIYTLNGFNPYTEIDAMSSTVGSVPEGFATSPWGLILGNLFYPAWLPSKEGSMYLLLFSAITIIITCFYLMAYFEKFYKNYIWIVPFLMCTTPSLFLAVCNRNASAVISCLIMLIILLDKKHDTTVGILLGICMIKPQMCGLMCVILLFEKRIKPLIVAAIIDISAFAAVCILIEENPLTLLFQFINCDVGFNDGNVPFRGIFSFLMVFGTDASVVTILSGIFGICLTIIGYQILKKHPVENTFLQRILIFSPALICSHIWSYGWNIDKGPLAVLVICLTILFIRLEKYDGLLFACITCLILSAYVAYLTHNFVFVEREYIWLNETLGSIALCMSYIILIILFTKKQFAERINNIDWKKGEKQCCFQTKKQ